MLFEPLARGARFGDVDAGIELLLDVRALAACGLACVVALGAAIGAGDASGPRSADGVRGRGCSSRWPGRCCRSSVTDSSPSPSAGRWRRRRGAWLAGWHVVGGGVVVATRASAALAGLLVGSALLFWGLGGSWDADGYAPDARPRLAAAHAGDATGDATGDASLTMTSLAGALVYLDDARTASLRAPFVRAPCSPRARTPSACTRATARTTWPPRASRSSPGEEIALVALGPTLSFHAMADELALRVDRGGEGDPRDEGDEGVRRATEEHVGPGGFAVVAGALLVFLGGGHRHERVASAHGRAARAGRGGGGGHDVGAGALSAGAPGVPLPFGAARRDGRGVGGRGRSCLPSCGARCKHAGSRRWLVFASRAPAVARRSSRWVAGTPWRRWG